MVVFVLLCFGARWIARPGAQGESSAGVTLHGSRGTAQDALDDQAVPVYRASFQDKRDAG